MDERLTVVMSSTSRRRSNLSLMCHLFGDNWGHRSRGGRIEPSPPPLPMKRNLVLALIALIVLAGGAAATVAMLNSSRPAEGTLEALKEDISPERPLVTVVGTFQRGGHRRGYDNYGPGEVGDYIVVWPEWVIDKTAITPDSDGLAVSMTGETWSADGTPPVVRSLFDDSVVTGLPDPDPVYRFEEPWDLIGWMDAQLTHPQTMEANGYEYVGRFELNDQPSIRYEHRTRVSLSVVEIVEANPLLARVSRYALLDDGEPVLDFQETVISVSAGE